MDKIQISPKEFLALMRMKTARATPDFCITELATLKYVSDFFAPAAVVKGLLKRGVTGEVRGALLVHMNPIIRALAVYNLPKGHLKALFEAYDSEIVLARIAAMMNPYAPDYWLEDLYFDDINNFPYIAYGTRFMGRLKVEANYSNSVHSKKILRKLYLSAEKDATKVAACKTLRITRCSTAYIRSVIAK